jgi:nickel/cobalt transporter (NicO) family protein
VKRLVAVSLLTGTFVLGSAAVASAHPLGNFTVNHYDGLTFSTTSVRDDAVLDTAEIPTEQARHTVDSNGDGRISDVERATYAASMCTRLAAGLRLDVGTAPATFAALQSSYAYRPGAAGLSTARLTCTLTASVDLRQSGRVTLTDTFDQDRIGWHEITARGSGTHLVQSPVPAVSVSDALLHYPNDLLSSPLDVRRAVVQVVPGSGRSTVAAGVGSIPGAGPIARLVEHLNHFFTSLAGSRHLTFGVGLLAVLVSLLLGASHAALPGHGKTVMAAYLARKGSDGVRGSTRDAVVVGATVTITHTLGVIVLGLALSVSSSLAGESVTKDLGVVSGGLVALIGAGLLVTALLRRRQQPHHDYGYDHGHDHEHHHDHDHHGHSHARGRGRLGLVGMGVAGGLVPSPSALVVLLGAIALGRTWFGITLVLCYGIGMAATLTAAGILLVRVSDRWAGRVAHRLGSQRLAGAAPVMTAGLVLVVGLGLATRSLAV